MEQLQPDRVNLNVQGSHLSTTDQQAQTPQQVQIHGELQTVRDTEFMQVYS